MSTYKPPLDGRRDFDGLLLDFNEATRPISQQVQNALLEFIQKNEFHNYPEYGDITDQLAEYTGCDKNQLMITNGSDQAIDVLFRTFTTKKSKVIIPNPSFSMFSHSANLCENQITHLQYLEDGSFPLKETLSHLNNQIKLAVICNPNNPTGTLLSLDEVEEIVNKAKDNNTVVFIDEAYFEYTDVTAATLLNRFNNLVITRTFSKAFGLSAFRIGYLMAKQELISEMLKVRGPYDVNMPATIAATASLKDVSSMHHYVDEVMNTSKPFVEKYFQENKIEHYPSGANFILTKSKNAERVIQKLMDLGIRVRPQKGPDDNICVRVTIGELEQMKEFIKKYSSILKE